MAARPLQNRPCPVAAPSWGGHSASQWQPRPMLGENSEGEASIEKVGRTPCPKYPFRLAVAFHARRTGLASEQKPFFCYLRFDTLPSFRARLRLTAFKRPYGVGGCRNWLFASPC